MGLSMIWWTHLLCPLPFVGFDYMTSYWCSALDVCPDSIFCFWSSDLNDVCVCPALRAGSSLSASWPTTSSTRSPPAPATCSRSWRACSTFTSRISSIWTWNQRTSSVWIQLALGSRSSTLAWPVNWVSFLDLCKRPQSVSSPNVEHLKPNFLNWNYIFSSVILLNAALSLFAILNNFCSFSLEGTVNKTPIWCVWQ